MIHGDSHFAAVWVGGGERVVLQKAWHLEVREVGSWPAAPELRCWISWER